NLPPDSWLIGRQWPNRKRDPNNDGYFFLLKSGWFCASQSLKEPSFLLGAFAGVQMALLSLGKIMSSTK
ncbi:hypothetical protein PROFUN_16359, partial [Planoprotostelium fungivorum]